MRKADSFIKTLKTGKGTPGLLEFCCMFPD